MIGCKPKEHGSRQPVYGRFDDIRKGDKVVYYATRDKVIVGIFDVVSDMEYLKSDPEWGEELVYRIKPEVLPPRGKYLDFKALIKDPSVKFDLFPDKERWRYQIWGHTCRPLTKNDFNLIYQQIQKLRTEPDRAHEMKGFIAVCTNETERECLKSMLFGSLKSWFDKVSLVRKGDIGFLLNLDKNTLYGIFRAETIGMLDIVPEAWGGRFPAQIRVSWEKQFDPLPNARQLLEGLGIHYPKYVLTSEELKAIVKAFERPEQITFFTVRPGLRAPLEEPRFKTDDGHFVKSKSEVLIDNWLYHHNLVHAYERKVPVAEDLTCDFYVLVAQCYIEYWGLEGFEDYEKRKEKKIYLYQRYHLKLVGLKDKDIERLDDILPKRLAQYLPRDFILQ